MENRVSRSRVFDELITSASMQSLCYGLTFAERKSVGYANVPDYWKPGGMIKALSKEEREIIKTATEKDFNGRFCA